LEIEAALVEPGVVHGLLGCWKNKLNDIITNKNSLVSFLCKLLNVTAEPSIKQDNVTVACLHTEGCWASIVPCASKKSFHVHTKSVRPEWLLFQNEASDQELFDLFARKININYCRGPCQPSIGMSQMSGIWNECPKGVGQFLWDDQRILVAHAYQQIDLKFKVLEMKLSEDFKTGITYRTGNRELCEKLPWEVPTPATRNTKKREAFISSQASRYWKDVHFLQWGPITRSHQPRINWNSWKVGGLVKPELVPFIHEMDLGSEFNSCEIHSWLTHVWNKSLCKTHVWNRSLCNSSMDLLS
jgi:hypothetical protein